MDGGTYGYVQEVEPVLASRCWCDGVAVLVPRDEVLQGLTRSCGWARCHGPAGEIVRGTHAPASVQTADLAALREAGRVIVVGPRLRTKRGPRPK
jgi:hypothetical protein